MSSNEHGSFDILKLTYTYKSTRLCLLSTLRLHSNRKFYNKISAAASNAKPPARFKHLSALTEESIWLEATDIVMNAAVCYQSHL